MPNTCCNLNCNQGRECPANPEKQDKTIIEGISSWIFGFLCGALMVASLIGVIRLFIMVINHK
jgi:hypothetical protein